MPRPEETPVYLRRGDLAYLILQFLKVEGYTEALHMLEQESGLFLDLKYVEKLLLDRELDLLERYLSSFTNIHENRYSRMIFFEIRKLKYFESLNRLDASKAADILFKDLKPFHDVELNDKKAVLNEGYLQALAAAVQSWKEGKLPDSNMARARENAVVNLKRLIEVNPVLKKRLAFPSFDLLRLEMLVNQSMNHQHSVCKNQMPDPVMKTLFVDHSCDTPNEAQAPPPVANNAQVTVGVDLTLRLGRSGETPSGAAQATPCSARNPLGLVVPKKPRTLPNAKESRARGEPPPMQNSDIDLILCLGQPRETSRPAPAPNNPPVSLADRGPVTSGTVAPPLAPNNARTYSIPFATLPPRHSVTIRTVAPPLAPNNATLPPRHSVTSQMVATPLAPNNALTYTIPFATLPPGHSVTSRTVAPPLAPNNARTYTIPFATLPPGHSVASRTVAPPLAPNNARTYTIPFATPSRRPVTSQTVAPPLAPNNARIPFATPPPRHPVTSQPVAPPPAATLPPEHPLKLFEKISKTIYVSRTTEQDSFVVEPSKCRSLKLPDPNPAVKISVLIFTNSGTGLLSLASNATHRLWNWAPASGQEKASASIEPALLYGIMMTNIGSTRKDVECCALSNNDEYAISACGEKVSLFDISTFTTMSTGIFPLMATSLAFNPKDNNITAIGMQDSTIQIYNWRDSQVQCVLSFGHEKKVTGLTFSSELLVLVSSGADFKVCVWNAVTWTPLNRIELKGPGVNKHGDTKVQFHSDQIRFLVVHQTLLAVFKAPTLDCVSQWSPNNKFPAGITSGTYSCDSKLVYATFVDGAIGVFDSETLVPQCRISPSIYMPPYPRSSSVLPLVVAAHTHHPNLVAVALSNGTVFVLEPLESEAGWSAMPPRL